MNKMQPVQAGETHRAQQPDLPNPPVVLPWRPWGFLIWLGVALVTHALFFFYPTMLPAIENKFKESGEMLPWSIRIYFALINTLFRHYVPTGCIILVSLTGGLVGLHFLLRNRPVLQRVYASCVVIGLFLILAVFIHDAVSYVKVGPK